MLSPAGWLAALLEKLIQNNRREGPKYQGKQKTLGFHSLGRTLQVLHPDSAINTVLETKTEKKLTCSQDSESLLQDLMLGLP